jgi:hypothetical protein
MAKAVDYEKDYEWLLDGVRQHPRVRRVWLEAFDYAQQCRMVVEVVGGGVRHWLLQGWEHGESVVVNERFPPERRHLALLLAWKLLDDGQDLKS